MPALYDRWFIDPNNLLCKTLQKLLFSSMCIYDYILDTLTAL